MNTLKNFFGRNTHFSCSACFAGCYAISVGVVIGVIEGTQMLLGLI